jgi:dUTP pyrophosphatase
MDNKDLEEYLKQLKEFEEDINSDKPIDDEFFKQVDTLINSLSKDMSTTQKVDTSGMLDGTLVKVKKLNPNAVIPSYSKVGDAGMDLTITSIIENTSFSVSYGFGIAIEIPTNFVGLVFPRSSVRNQELILSNCVGVIDSGYRGEIQATFKKTNGLDSISYKVGDRGAQIIILPYPTIYMTEVPELSNTERGTGGFGSTGV